MKNSEFLELEGVTIEFDDRQTHEVYYKSQFFFARIEHGTSTLVQFIPLIKEGQAFPTFIDGGRVRIDGEVFIVLDHRWGTLPISVYSPEPPFDPMMMGVYVHRIHSLSDVADPFPDTVWSNVPGRAHMIPDDDMQLRQVAHGRHIAKLLTTKVEDINALMKEGSSESDIAGDIKDVQQLIDYNLRVMLKNVTRKHIRGV
jgi:hypothetical protein